MATDAGQIGEGVTIMYWFDHGWGLLNAVLGLGLMVLVVTAVVLLIRSLARPQRPDLPDPYAGSPERLLAERYARGEIDDEEYRRRLDTLRRTR